MGGKGICEVLGVTTVFMNARSRLWSMGPSPNFHSLLFMLNYDDLPNISQIGVCEKILGKGATPNENVYRHEGFQKKTST